MTDPGDIDPELASLLATEAATDDELPTARRAEIRAKLDAALRPGGGDGGGGSEGGEGGGGHGGPAGGGTSAPATPPGLLRGALLLVTGGAIGAALHAAVATTPAPTVTTASAMATATAAAISATAVAVAETAPPAITPGDLPAASASFRTPLAAPRPSESIAHGGVDSGAPAIASAPAAEPPAPDAGARSTSLTEERSLVERARAALARRDGVSALVALREHETRFPDGRLAEERDALVVQSLAAAGHGDDARRKAAIFRTKYPGSIFSGRVEESVRDRP